MAELVVLLIGTAALVLVIACGVALGIHLGSVIDGISSIFADFLAFLTTHPVVIGVVGILTIALLGLRWAERQAVEHKATKGIESR